MPSDSTVRLAKALAALSGRQQAFVLAYLSDPSRNATAAYRAAGYKAKDAAAGASEILTNPKVRAAIEAAEEPVADKLIVTVERIEREWARIAFADMRDAATWGPNSLSLIDSADLDDDTAVAIREIGAEVRFESGHTADDPPIEIRKQHVKLHDKTVALRELGKRHGFYERPRGKGRRGLTEELVDVARRHILGMYDDEDNNNDNDDNEAEE